MPDLPTLRFGQPGMLFRRLSSASAELLSYKFFRYERIERSERNV
jgi:hypothetical protein